MFAYCGNNPVGYYDPSGCYFRPYHNDVAMLFYEGLGGGGFSPSGRSGGNFKSLVANTSEEKVLEAEDLAFYKGVLVIRVPGDSAFSFGVIFFGEDINSVNLVRHEYGHIKQFQELGVIGYASYVAVPSIVCFCLDEADALPDGLYYNLPWEYKADAYGQVSWGHEPWANYAGEIYWYIAKLLTSIIS